MDGPRPRWHVMEDWLGESIEPVEPSQGYPRLVHRWLDHFGPGAQDDIVWWLGATKGIVRTELADVAAVEVDLDNGQVGYVLPDDVAEEAPVEPWAALLPVLDATTMVYTTRQMKAEPLPCQGSAPMGRCARAHFVAGWWTCGSRTVAIRPYSSRSPIGDC